ncbi:Helix-turn-helix domain-containing protein [Agreia bicolorata]|uniref:Helix-turn-helix domain-containing protein n=1 Tax=Agreia bicolorata TaxID=110935 RepID=A0A1T4YL80_9MICO|nr:helix-turn-helix domain-containing protein [Agreia bicolorata]SKB02450.1 Helix-turn-helix domain-containing protein [Agreia bicolorata]
MPEVQVRKISDIGAIVKATREAKGIRQDDLATSLGFSRNYLRELESGRPNLFTTRLFRALHRLGITVSVTYDLTGKRNDG